MLACVSSHSVLHILKKLLLPRNLALEGKYHEFLKKIGLRFLWQRQQNVLIVMHCIVVDCQLPEFEEGTFTNSNYSDGSGKSIELSSGRFETQLWCDWGSNEEILNVLLSCITTFSSDPNVSIGASAGDDDLLAIIRDDTTRCVIQPLTIVTIHSSFLTHTISMC